MATNLNISENQERVPLTISAKGVLRSITPDNGSPYYVGARAYVTQTASGATVTVIDKEGTTTAVILNGANGQNGADGQDGADGNGIVSIDLTSTVGNVDTYTITYDDGSTDTFEVTNGIDGQDGTDGVDGVDGFSPTATVTKSGDTATITITDKNGTTTATVQDGTQANAFTAEFGTTTYADVKDAYDDGAIIICTADDSGNTMVLQLVYFDATNEIFFFAEPNGDGVYWTELSNANGWDDGTRYFASTDVATQLADGLMSALDKQKLDGLSKRNIWYGTCSTSASSSPKSITTASGDFSLTAGNMLCVLFSHTNSLSSASLQVDGGASKSVYSMGGTSDISNRWGSNEVVSFVYDGTKFIMLEQGLASTTQYGITKLNNTVTSTSTSEAATANAVKSAYDHGGVTSVNGSTGAVTVTVPTITDTYDGTSSNGMSGKAVKSAIDALDGTVSGSAGSGKTLTAFSQTDGKVSATFGNISITKSQVSDFPTIPTNVSDLNNDSGFTATSITRYTTTGTNIADLTIDGTTTKLYAPTGGGGGITDVEVDGTSVVTGGVAEIDLTGKSDVGHTHTTSAITDFPTLATVATSGSYNDLLNKPTIPTVNNATLTIQKNSTNVATFTANASSNVTANISVPTDTGDLTNGAGFITGYTETDPVFSASAASGISSSDISTWNGKSDFSGDYDDLSNKPTIPSDTGDLTNGAGFITSSDIPVTDVTMDGSSVVTSGVAEFETSSLIDIFYPVGSYYETSDTSFDPNVSWGGTWSLETAGQVHISAGTGYAVAGALTNTTDGGEETHKLLENEMPSHLHSAVNGEAGFLAYKWNAGVGRNRHTTASSGKYVFGSSTSGDLMYAAQCGATGGTSAHNNMQPYIIVNRWHRTA